MRRKRLADLSHTVTEGHIENQRWSMYLASLANPFAAHVSYDEFKQRTAPDARSGAAVKKPAGMTSKELKHVIARASAVLSNFAPTGGGG